MSEQNSNQIYSEYTNTNKNHALASAHSDTAHVLTKYPDGKIYEYNGANGAPSNKIMQASWLVDTNLLVQAKAAKEAGDVENYTKIMDAARSPLFKDLLIEGAKQEKRIDNAGYMSPSAVLLGRTSIAAAGNQILNTAQEVVRQTNYITKVTGVFYRNEKYQAVNLVNKISTNDLTLKGAIDTQLPVGHPEIGDDQTPEITRPMFDTYEKQIFADSFHYGFGMREKSDAFFNIQERMTSKVAGVMLRMKNEKIVNIINAMAGSTLTDGVWNSYLQGNVAADASKAVEDLINAVEDLDGEIVIGAPRHSIRAYQRNVQGRNVTATPSNQPANNRSGKLEFNEEATYFVDNALTDYSFTVISKDAWTDHFIGPQVDIAYKDNMKPSGWEGRILFHFNGIETKIAAAAQKKTGVST